MNIIDASVEGRGQSSSILVTPGGVRLPDQPARYILLSNWNVENDAAFTLKNAPGDLMEEIEAEVYWGFNGVYAHQLFPGRSTELIPCSNLKQICLRSRPGDQIQIWYSWIL